MRKEILQSLLGTTNISRSKHECAGERTRQTNSPGIALDHLDVFPPVLGNTSSCVDGHFRADLDADHFTRWSYGTNEVRETPARSATHIENTIALFQMKQIDRLLTHRFYEGRIEIWKRPDKMNRISKVRWCEVLSFFFHTNTPCSNRSSMQCHDHAVARPQRKRRIRFYRVLGH